MASATASDRLHASPFGPGRTLSGPRELDLVLPRMREMTGYEEAFIEACLAEANTARVCNGLLARCLVAPGQEPGAALDQVRALSVADRDRALVQLRRRSLGDALRAEVDCPACGEGNEVEASLVHLDQPTPALPERVSVELADGREATMRLPNAGDQADMIDAGAATGVARRSWLLARVLLRIGEREGPLSFEDAHALPTSVRRLLEQALAKVLPDSELSMAVSCHACGHEFAAPFDISSFFLTS